MLSYKVYVKDGDYWSKATDGKAAGSVGKSRMADAFGIDASSYPLEFRIFVEDQGWRGWHAVGEASYDTGGGNRLQAIQFRFPNGLPPGVFLLGSGHVEKAGWQPTVRLDESNYVGTYDDRRLEAVQLAFTTPHNGGGRVSIDPTISAVHAIIPQIVKKTLTRADSNRVLSTHGIDMDCISALVQLARDVVDSGLAASLTVGPEAGAIQCSSQPLACADALVGIVTNSQTAYNSCLADGPGPSNTGNESSIGETNSGPRPERQDTNGDGGDDDDKEDTVPFRDPARAFLKLVQKAKQTSS